ncbi:GTPase-activating Rap/Ran-GAP domain-like protein 3 [Manis javanica]|nr:GTPase-activating Rap/Ran-GAP domain-like protein 3 [Manis javanica]
MGIVFLIPYSYPVWVGWAGRRGERNKEAELLSVHSVHTLEVVMREKILHWAVFRPFSPGTGFLLCCLGQVGFSDWMQDLE